MAPNPDDFRVPAFRTLWLKAVGCTDLDPTAKLIALTIGAYMDGKATAWPSLSTIAGRASLNERTVRRRLPDLEDAEILIVHRGGGRGRRSTYQGWIPGHLVSTFPTVFPEQLVDRMGELGVWNPGYVDIAAAKGGPDDTNVDSDARYVDTRCPTK